VARSIINDGVQDDDSPIAAINVTPLVDVMFCLLIIFMVATPLMATAKVENLELPAARGEKMSDEEFLYSSVIVDKTGRIFLGTLPLSGDLPTLKEQLRANVKLNEHGMVFIQGDQNVDYEKIVDVLVALQAAEISRVGFVTDPNLSRIKEAR